MICRAKFSLPSATLDCIPLAPPSDILEASVDVDIALLENFIGKGGIWSPLNNLLPTIHNNATEAYPWNQGPNNLVTCTDSWANRQRRISNNLVCALCLYLMDRLLRRVFAVVAHGKG